VYADVINSFAENINTIKKNTEAPLDTSKEVGLQINTEKTKCMFMSHHQNTGQNHNFMMANKSFENVAKFGHLKQMWQIRIAFTKKFKAD
jgi:hypothetical protein